MRKNRDSGDGTLEKTENPQHAEKKTWVVPAATIEQVSEATQISGGGSGDGASCHS